MVQHAAGKPEVAIPVAKRVPRGDEEYVKVPAEKAAFLTRSSLGVLLGRDRSCWYELRVVPEDVQPTTIISVAVSGSSTGAPFTLVRAPAGQGYQWQLQRRSAPVNQTAAAAMIGWLSWKGPTSLSTHPAQETRCRLPSWRSTVTASPCSGSFGLP